MMGRVLKAELYKIKHTWILWIHGILPVLYALAFYAACQFTGIKNFMPDETIQNYFTLLGAAVPIVVGVLISKVADMESGAGHFQLLLSAPSRTRAYLGKAGALFLGFIWATSVAVGVFGGLFGHQTRAVWFAALLLLLAASVAVYLIHLWVALALGSVPSMGLGVAETLIALLAITGLGDKIWYFIPCTWPARLPGTYILASSYQNHSFLAAEMAKWGFSALPMTAVIFIGSVIWFNRWDGGQWGD
ncbi:lantibiotic immunity ABC transporter MutG family permease subunit [Peptoniphilus sp. HCN-40583]|uniref:lantibiotic immunity ABC transporter MutG family permease subunit n=1 Tax=Peptoniphilus sp. HCN-40583 TaxID=3134662 RepID=UPI0030BD00A8